MDNCGRNEAAGLKLVHFHNIGSTNARAFELASQGAEEWTVVASDTQTKGMGRHGKTWISSHGGLYMSVILRPEISPKEAGLLQILGGTSARSAVHQETGTKALLKWPNDLILDTRKLGGVLVGVRTVQNKPSFAVVGIGLNVNQTEELLPEDGTSVFQHTSRRHDLEKLLVRVIDEMRSRYALLGDSAKLVSEWWDYCVHKQRTIRVEGPQGVMVGLCKGISPEGRLIVETAAGRTVNIDEGTLTVAE